MSERSKLEIAIIGAGIGGLAAATLLARAGHTVRVFDQFEAPRPIGSGLMLQQTGLAVLDKLGLRAPVEALGSRIDRLWGLTTPSQRPVLDVEYHNWKADLYGLGVQRSMLFDALLNAATESGVQLIASSQMVSADPQTGHVQFSGKPKLTGHDLTLIAFGARPGTTEIETSADLPYGALWATLPWPQDGPFDTGALEQRYFKSRQMTGVMASGKRAADAPLSLTYFWSIRSNQEQAWRQSSLDAWKQEAIALWPETECLVTQFEDHDALAFARYRHHTRSKPVPGPRLAYLGDAWHSTSPQLGQGANMALLDAWALSVALAEKPALDDALQHYVRLRRFHIWLYQTMSWLFTPVYQSDSAILPFLRDGLAAPLSRLWPAPPILAAMVAGSIGAPLKRLGLETSR